LKHPVRDIIRNVINYFSSSFAVGNTKSIW